MKPVKQTITSGPHMNCLQAAVASVLELPLEDVPNFAEWYDDPNWGERYDAFLLQHGVYPIEIAPENPDGFSPKIYGYHLVGVETATGVLHEMVGFAGQIVYDPYPFPTAVKQVVSYTLFVSVMGYRAGDPEAITQIEGIL